MLHKEHPSASPHDEDGEGGGDGVRVAHQRSVLSSVSCALHGSARVNPYNT